jgi:hypothetical protein
MLMPASLITEGRSLASGARLGSCRSVVARLWR